MADLPFSAAEDSRLYTIFGHAAFMAHTTLVEEGISQYSLRIVTDDSTIPIRMRELVVSSLPILLIQFWFECGCSAHLLFQPHSLDLSLAELKEHASSDIREACQLMRDHHRGGNVH